MKCRYKFCKHDSRDIAPGEEVRNGQSSYYHKDCLQEKQDKDMVIDIFLKQINPNTPVAQLVRIINIIVHKRGVSSEFLLYAVRYYLEHKIPLNYPSGLYYVINNKDAITSYNNAKAAIDKPVFDLSNVQNEKFNYKKPKKKTLDNLLG